MPHATIRPSDVWRTLSEQPLRLIVPALAITLLAAVYALVRPATWEASQALVVRNETGDHTSRPGKFTLADEMKATQETILELAKSRNVLSKALASVGPPSQKRRSAPYPSERDVEALAGNVKVTPPKGAEFGKTEVFYLKVRDGSQQRAVDLAAAVCKQLQDRFAGLREAKANSTTDELNKSVSLAQADLANATKNLQQMEKSIGSDLAELRILNELPSGDSDLRRTSTDLEKEIRTYRASYDESQEFLKLLTAAQNDPKELLASPAALIKSQPAIGRLKDGLVDAQIRTGNLLGTMSENHPLVKNSRAAERALHQQLINEIEVAKNGVQVEMRVNSEHVKSLEKQLGEIQDRLERLATVRAEYANLVASAKSRGETLKTVEHGLSEARASRAAANSTSLINLLDTPDAGTKPLGPGRMSILLAGIVGGLVVGLAVIFLGVSPTPAVNHEPKRSAALVGPAVGSLTVLSLKQALQRVADHRWAKHLSR